MARYEVVAPYISVEQNGKVHQMQGDTVEFDDSDPRVKHYLDIGAIVKASSKTSEPEEVEGERPRRGRPPKTDTNE